MACITTQEEILSDGSRVWNVLVCSDQDHALLKFHCVTKRDASEFETKLYLAIRDHTVDAFA
jgi:hypothetical protein